MEYVSRKKLRSVILTVILAALAVSVLVCLAVGGSANAAAAEMKKEFGASFTIEVDPQKTTYQETTLKDGSKRMKPVMQTLSPDMVRSFLQMDGVTSYRSDFTSIGIYFDLDVIPGFYDYLLNDPEEDTEYDKRDYHVRGHDMQIYCVLNSETHEYFDSGAFELVEGRHITLDDNDKDNLVVLVSDKIAEMKGLKVGDTITGENRANMVLAGGPDDVLGNRTSLR
jgi:putative ABC transport system permease protein